MNNELVPKRFDYYPREIIAGHTDVDVFEDAMKMGDDVLLEGPTGSGKTALVRFYCAKHRKPYRRISLNGGCTAEDIVGHYIIMNKETIWVDGLVTQACRNGWVIAVDEINAAPPDILFVFNSLLDDERILILSSKDGEIVHPHPDFRLIATCNPTEQGYAGTSEMNEALIDRFETILYIDYNTDVESKIIDSMGVNKDMKKDLLDFVAKIRQAHRNNEVRTPFSTRSLINLIKFHQKGETLLLLNRFKSEERDAVKDLLDLFIMKNPVKVKK